MKLNKNNFLAALGFMRDIYSFIRPVNKNTASLNLRQYITINFTDENKKAAEQSHVTIYAIASRYLHATAKDIDLFVALSQAMKKYMASILKQKQMKERQINKLKNEIADLGKMQDDIMLLQSQINEEKETNK